MSLSDVKTLYALSVLSLSLLLASPTIALVVPLPEGERFSELWLLNSAHAADAYPFNVTVDTMYSVFVGVGNHMGGSEYYVVYVKIRNQTQPLPDIARSQASALAPVYEFRFLLENNDSWESRFTFAFHNVTVQDTTMHVQEFAVNQRLFSVGLQSAWDMENQGFYYQIFFELWHYDATSHGFQFHNRFVFVWLNMTF
jgi:uncharacterized membrane protein